ncbi:MAG: hypothetical protein H8F28_26705 [Fibrella sp.]|nr:hypothetical protein [Armatimonadota bacterium]
MSRYFILGNLWVLFAIILRIGGRVERTEPTMISFFGVGGWLYPVSYYLIIAVAGVMAAFCFLLAAKMRGPAER